MVLMFEEISEEGDVFSPTHIVERRADDLLYEEGLVLRPSTLMEVKRKFSASLDPDLVDFKWMQRPVPEEEVFTGTIQWLGRPCIYFKTFNYPFISS